MKVLVNHSKSKYLINGNPGKLSQKMFKKKSAAPSFVIPEDIVEGGGGGGVDDRLDVNASLAEAM